MNALWPTIIIIAGAAGWWLIRYIHAHQPSNQVAPIVVVVILLLLWLVSVSGVWSTRQP